MRFYNEYFKKYLKLCKFKYVHTKNNNNNDQIKYFKNIKCNNNFKYI